ncbi:nitroreductase family protein [Nocardia ninae]|uniref:NAD(P)H nitroreductase n=2 Tax=Nocardia ninae TaxID=356145 RepID=A0A511M633_9NOCA|nr:NAD(P)H nitroreductase [Nocardia ninae NBRC 108245]
MGRQETEARDMDYGLPDSTTLETALALAARAPSVADTQPWRWQIGSRSIHLYLDPAWAADPDQRGPVLSCGASLHHLRVALAALGWSAVVRRLPNPAQPNHLASVRLLRHRPTPVEIALSAAISRRRTDDRHFTSLPIPPGCLGLVTERATALGALVRRAADPAREQVTEPSDRTPNPDFAELLVIGTPADDRTSRLRAGEALSAVLLTATNIGLATSLLTHPLETPELRRTVRTGVLDGTAHPQAVVRIGWAPTGTGSPEPTREDARSWVCRSSHAGPC